jgi:serine/threonine-protein kinase RsbW
MVSAPPTPRCLEPDRPDEPSAGWRERRLQTFADQEPALVAVLQQMEAAGFPEKDQFAVRLALDEALANAVKHGNRLDPTKWVTLRYRVAPETLLAEVEDEGPGFDPEKVPDPLAPENLERTCGRGVYLMRCYMTWVRYNERGNRVTLCKYRTPS